MDRSFFSFPSVWRMPIGLVWFASLRPGTLVVYYAVRCLFHRQKKERLSFFIIIRFTVGGRMMLL